MFPGLMVPPLGKNSSGVEWRSTVSISISNANVFRKSLLPRKCEHAIIKIHPTDRELALRPVFDLKVLFWHKSFWKQLSSYFLFLASTLEPFVSEWVLVHRWWMWKVQALRLSFLRQKQTKWMRMLWQTGTMLTLNSDYPQGLEKYWKLINWVGEN